jgi:hypothetical protein
VDEDSNIHKTRTDWKLKYQVRSLAIMRIPKVIVDFQMPAIQSSRQRAIAVSKKKRRERSEVL